MQMHNNDTIKMSDTVLRKIRSWEKSILLYSALNMPNSNGKIIGAEGVRTFIGYSGYLPIA